MVSMVQLDSAIHQEKIGLSDDGNIWLNQNQLAEFFTTSKPNISPNISNMLK